LTFTFKQPTTIEILPVSESDNIRLMSPESGQPRSWRVATNLAGIWIDLPDSGHLAREPTGSGQRGWISAVTGRQAGIRPFVPDFGLYLEFWLYLPESSKNGQNLIGQ
jgi:hypothetical protein